MPRFKTREYLSEYNGMMDVIKTTHTNGSVVYHTMEYPFIDEAYDRGACKLNVSDNVFGLYLHLFNSNNETVGVYKMTPRLRGFTIQQLADQHKKLFFCKKFNQHTRFWETYVDGKLLKVSIYKEGCGLATILKDDKWAVIDKNNDYIVPPGKYDYIDGFDKCGLARVKISGKADINNPALSTQDRWGIIDTKGNEVLEAKYDEIWAFYGKNRKTTRIMVKELEMLYGRFPILHDVGYDYYLDSRYIHRLGYYIDGGFHTHPYIDTDEQYSVLDALDGEPEAAGNIDYIW